MLIITILLFVIIAMINKEILLNGRLGIFIFPIIWGLIFPSLFYCFNPRVRQFYVRMFWDEAPDWLQQFNPNHVVEIQLNRY